MKIRLSHHVVLVLVAAIMVNASMAIGDGVLSDSRYQDDFEGGPFLEGWDPGITSFDFSNNEYLGPANWIQTPYMPETLFGNSNVLVRVEFDFVPYSDSFANHPSLDIDFSTTSQGIGYTESTSLSANRDLIGNGRRYWAIVPFANIPREPDTEPQSPRRYGVRISRVSSPNYPWEEFGIDNFVIDWSHSADAPTLAWDFNSPDIPSGWITSGYAGAWTKLKTPQSCGPFWCTGPTYWEGLVAKHDGNSPPYQPLELGANDELRIDAWTPEFRFTNLASAVLGIDLNAIVGDALNDQVLIDLYRTSMPGTPSDEQPALANLLTLNLVDFRYNTLNGKLSLPILERAFGGEAPTDHVDNQTIYRVRTRVFDNDVNLNSFEIVEIDNMSISNAVMHVRGDYNFDDVVDGADFIVWQQNLGLAGAADGNGNGVVDAGDLTIWRGNYGLSTTSVSVSSHSTGAVLPEPTSTLLVILGSVIGLHLART
ncbi:MAG TPA: hypothetical protein PKC18_02685 [Lacipirellulaceae bacterium]|nr:hypothetical protein [Lacipirellulaceae bacterium]HMP05930.1 hypothetical protein [Lacipirellulaceae bacterium]